MAVEKTTKPEVASMSVSEASRPLSLWRCGDFALDEATLELRVAGEPVAIEPKPLEMLLWLLRHAGEVVTKEELLDALWFGRVVSESVLTSCVGKLRHALRDDAHALIKTVHGYGYRLAAPVQRDLRLRSVTPTSSLRPGEPPPHRPNWRLVRRLPASLDETWLVEHAKSGERRVLKFAFDAAQLSRIKREITLHRLLRQALGPRDDLVAVLDWNLEQLPCFVEFEWCELGSLLDAFDGEQLSAVPLTERLGLAAAAAEALAAAHSAGVLHKDIKPGNVLLRARPDGSRMVKLADFGSGALVDDDRLRQLQITRLGFTQEIGGPGSGTYSYLAPEVLAGQPPTVRSDVYALGILLYQLVVADLRRSLAPGWERDIDDELLRADIAECCDVDPTRRLGDAGEVARRLTRLDERRDALDAGRRAEAAAAELRSALARVRARRRWLAVVATVASVGLAVSAVMLAQTRTARAEAEAQAAVARSINDYLVDDLLGAADPMANRGPLGGPVVGAAGQVPVRDLLDRAEAGAERRFAGQPRLETAVRMSLGQAYYGLSVFEAAERQLLIAARIAREGHPADAIAEAAALHRAAAVARDMDRFDAADAHLASAREALRRVDSARRAETRRLAAEVEQTQAWILYKRGDYPRSIAGFESVLPDLRSAFGAISHEVADAHTKVSGVKLAAGDLQGSAASAREGLAIRLQVDPPEHPRLIDARAALSDALRFTGADLEAEREIRSALGIATRTLGPDHFRTLIAQTSLASTLQQLGRHAEAILLFEDAVERSSRRFGDASYEIGVFHNNLGLAYADAGRFDDAVASLQRGLEAGRRLLGVAHPENLKVEHNIADVMADAGQWQQALAIERRLLPLARKTFGERHLFVGLMQRTTGRILLRTGDVPAAIAVLKDARAILVEALGDSHAKVAQVDALLAEAASAPAVRASARGETATR